MGSPEMRRPRHGSGVGADNRNYQPPRSIARPADSEQLELWADAIPAHRLAPAERHLRLVANVRHERSHWWIRMIHEHQAQCDWCRRCDGEAVA
jgi:hypothetical protein